MYGFIEKELAIILQEEGYIASFFDDFATSSGETVALVDRMSFTFAKSILANMSGGDRVAIVPSDIAGMRILLHPYWMKEHLFDALTPGEAKEYDLYLQIRTAPAQTRFDWTMFLGDFRREVQQAMGRRADIGDENMEGVDLEGDGFENEAGTAAPAETEGPTAEEILADEVVPEPEPVKLTPEEEAFETTRLFFRKYGLNYETVSTDVGIVAISYNTELPNDIVTDFAVMMNKNVIILTGASWATKTKNEFKDLPDEVRDNILCIHPKATHPKFYTPCFYDITHTLFGYEIGGLKQLHHGSTNINNGNHDPENPHHLGPAFAEFDYAYRDYKTGVIWALQRKNEVFFLLDITYLNRTVCDLILRELGERYMGRIPYTEMLRRDIAYFDAKAEHDKSKFVDMAIQNSRKLIDELESQLLKAREEYKVATDKAMEQAKTTQRLEDNLLAIDEEKLSSIERERCLTMFSDVLEIPKVSAVKVIGEIVNVYTKNIYVYHEKNKTWHDVGTFHIQIGMYSAKYDTARTVRIFNTKHQIHAFNEQMQAPHVFEDGHLCHGNATAPMIDAYKRRDMYQMVLMLIMFLEAANLDDSAGGYLNRWPEVTEEVATAPEVGEEETAMIFEDQTEEELEFDKELEIPIHL